MRYESTHQPVILLIDAKTGADNKFVKSWFRKSRFLTCEADDIFQALEEISDFTMARRPQVVLLEVASMPEDFRAIKKMIQTPAGYPEMPIFALSENGNVVNDEACFEGDLKELAARLELIIPGGTSVKQAIAA